MSKKLEPCADCSGITYRQTTSGKIIPASHICPSKITPPCYQPDGDGCAYQTYGDGGEPIDKCKECPHCYTDKVRHESNDPLTLEELRGMAGEPVWLKVADGRWGLVDADCDEVTLSRGGSIELEKLIGRAYRRPMERDGQPAQEEG